MPSRRDSSSRLLRELFDHARKNRQAVTELTSELALPAGTTFEQLLNFDDDVVHAEVSRRSLRLDSADEADAAMLRAFKAAGLDHRNPFDWRTLLSRFAEVHFGKRKTKPIKWDIAALLELFWDWRCSRT